MMADVLHQFSFVATHDTIFIRFGITYPASSSRLSAFA